MPDLKIARPGTHRSVACDIINAYHQNNPNITYEQLEKELFPAVARAVLGNGGKITEKAARHWYVNLIDSGYCYGHADLARRRVAISPGNSEVIDKSEGVVQKPPAEVINERRTRPYIGLIHKDPDSDYSVSFPDLLGCITAGITLDEAREFASEALALHLDGMAADGEAIPEPSSLEENARATQKEAQQVREPRCQPQRLLSSAFRVHWPQWQSQPWRFQSLNVRLVQHQPSPSPVR